MEEGYSPFKIAAFFIKKAHESGAKLTPMKLIKLVYIAHAWSLAFLNRKLISEPVQAWKYGPVIESLYHSFKNYGNRDISTGELLVLPDPSDIDSKSVALLDKIWGKYGRLSGTHLSALTHLPNTPWDTIWNADGGKQVRFKVIPNELIEHFYQQKLANPTTSGSGH